ncbi:hypothetical protein [Peribacillus butanolivorans]
MPSIQDTIYPRFIIDFLEDLGETKSGSLLESVREFKINKKEEAVD